MLNERSSTAAGWTLPVAKNPIRISLPAYMIRKTPLTISILIGTVRVGVGVYLTHTAKR